MAEVETKTSKRRIDARDWKEIENFITDELDRRKRKRKDLEGQWEEIDRQLRMEFDDSARRDAFGNLLPGMAWKPGLELPLQAQTLEILTSDARRMIDPTVGPWFRSHVSTTDEYLSRLEGGFSGLIAGDDNDVPSRVTQDNADKLLEGILGYVHRQNEWWMQWDAFNAEAFAYGTGVGRVRVVKKPVYIEQARGLARIEAQLPIFFPRSIKNTYLDDTPHHVMNEGQIIGPATIHTKTQKLADLILAARNGNTDPDDENGGWMPRKLSDIEADDRGNVEVIEWEGDLVIPRKTTENIFVPGAIVTVVRHDENAKVVRFRFRSKPYTSYVAHPYHIEQSGTPYGVGPLMKGEPVQRGASESFNRLMEAAILNTEPPLQYSPDDPQFVADGGPIVEPRALWGAAGDVVPHQIGDPAALLQVYTAFISHYADVTGMHAPRLGQQTVSHTTAFAKEAELSRGQVRTVDYANSLMQGPLTRVLEMQFDHIKDVWNETRNIYIPEYGGFVRVGPEAIPDEAIFEVFGSSGPAEKRARVADQLQALQLVASIEQAKMQLNQGEPLDFSKMQKQILRETGFADADAFFAQPPEAQTPNASGGPGVSGTDGVPAGVSIAAIQALEGQQG